MSLLNRMRVGTKITAASAGILIFLIAIGIVGVLALSDAKEDFATYRRLARQTNEVGRIQAAMLETQLHAKAYLLTDNADEAKAVTNRIPAIAKQIAAMKALFEDPKLQATVDTMGKQLASYRDSFAKIMELQSSRNDLTAELGDIGNRMEKALGSIMDSASTAGDTEGAYLAGMALRYFQSARADAILFHVDTLAEHADAFRKDMQGARDRGNGMLAKLDDFSRRK